MKAEKGHEIAEAVKQLEEPQKLFVLGYTLGVADGKKGTNEKQQKEEEELEPA